MGAVFTNVGELNPLFFAVQSYPEAALVMQATYTCKCCASEDVMRDKFVFERWMEMASKTLPIFVGLP